MHWSDIFISTSKRLTLHGGFPAFSLAVQNGASVGRNKRKHFSTHCRYQIKIPKTLFRSNRGSLQLKNGLTFSFGLHLDKLVRSHVWHFHLTLLAEGCDVHFSTHCRYQIKNLKALFNCNRGPIPIQKWSQIFILTSFRQNCVVHACFVGVKRVRKKGLTWGTKSRSF